MVEPNRFTGRTSRNSIVAHPCSTVGFAQCFAKAQLIEEQGFDKLLVPGKASHYGIMYLKLLLHLSIHIFYTNKYTNALNGRGQRGSAPAGISRSRATLSGPPPRRF
jgi:hypothetical protein